MAGTCGTCGGGSGGNGYWGAWCTPGSELGGDAGGGSLSIASGVEVLGCGTRRMTLRMRARRCWDPVASGAVG